jgi:predicted AlkP superfamily phosphohydrolase/phosphomutase
MRILVIGLDAATMDLIEPWAAAGYLPALAGLMNEGTSARLLSTPNMHSASAWTSILTGLNPGRHGLFVFSDRDFGTGKQVFFKGGDRTGELITAYIARHGLTSGLLNVPMTYPAQCGPGFMVSGLDAPSLNERAFSPPELRAELLNRFPEYHFSPQNLGDLMRAGRLDEAAAAWIKLTEVQTRAAEYLLASRQVDFFMTVYTASDWAGHNLWKYFAGSEGAKTAGLKASNPLVEIYNAIDQSIARLLNYANEETQVYVISDHGMGAHTGASYHLAGWLEDNGYMVRSARSSGRSSLISAGRRAARSVLPPAVRDKVRASLGEDRIERLQAAEKDSFYSSIAWESTAAYTEPGRHVININLLGRNAGGTVPESDYPQMCSRIIDDLSRWSDGRGVSVVDRVARREEIYVGPFTERASDLYVYWNPDADLGAPPDEVRDRGFWWSGDHRPEGIAICKGPGVRPGAKATLPAVYDLVPTMMYAAGLPVPDMLDGRVFHEFFTDEFIAAHPVEVGSAALPPTTDQLRLSPEEEQMVEEKLRGLGYI